MVCSEKKVMRLHLLSLFFYMVYLCIVIDVFFCVCASFDTTQPRDYYYVLTDYLTYYTVLTKQRKRGHETRREREDLIWCKVKVCASLCYCVMLSVIFLGRGKPKKKEKVKSNNHCIILYKFFVSILYTVCCVGERPSHLSSFFGLLVSFFKRRKVLFCALFFTIKQQV